MVTHGVFSNGPVKPLTIGGIRLSTNLLLAPLAGYTDLAFRLCCRLQGGVGLAVTEVITAAALNRNVARVDRFLHTSPRDRPLSVQIDGGDAAELVEAARRIEDAGHAIVDINMGCPVARLTDQGGGSKWTTTPDGAAGVIHAVSAAVSIPVTAKIRLGWDDEHITAPVLAAALEEAGAAAITVHGRTREQGFGGQVSLDGIRAVVEAVRRVPVIGNGDVRTPEDAQRMIEATGCQGVAIGRAALSDPWIFRDTWSVLAEGRLPPPPPFDERLAWVRRHVRHLVELMGERRGVLRFRKAGCHYARSLGLDKQYKRRVSLVNGMAEVETILTEVERGRHRRPPVRRPASTPIPLPAGPVDRW